MLGILAGLLLAGAALADTGEDLCKDWELTPTTLTTSSGNAHDFRINTQTQCREGMDCVWSLSNDVGSLSQAEGLYIVYDAPTEAPPECEPLDTSIVVTCILWESHTRTESAYVQVRCTDAQQDELAAQKAELLSVQGGGCTSPRQEAAWLLLLPLGLFGFRRRLRG